MGSFKKFCCCDLTTGVAIIGWLGLASGIINVCGGIAGDITGYKSFQIFSDDERVLIDLDLDTSRSTFITGNLIEVIINCALLWALKKNSKFLLLPWLISKMISLIAILFFTFGIGIFCLANTAVNYGIGILIAGNIISGIYAYCWMCTLSLYQHYNDLGQAPNRNLNTNIEYVENGLNQHNPHPYKVLM